MTFRDGLQGDHAALPAASEKSNFQHGVPDLWNCVASSHRHAVYKRHTAEELLWRPCRYFSTNRLMRLRRTQGNSCIVRLKTMSRSSTACSRNGSQSNLDTITFLSFLSITAAGKYSLATSRKIFFRSPRAIL